MAANADKVLSVADYEAIKEDLKSFQSSIVRYFEDVTSGIEIFDKTPVVQSFYASGQFGIEMEAELVKLKKGLKEYYDSLMESGGLIPTTKLVIEKQIENLNASNRGGGAGA